MHLRLQTKIIVSFAALLLVVSGTFAAYFDTVVSSRFESMTNQNVVQLAVKVSQHVDSYIHDMDQVSKSFATNGSVLGILADVAKNGPPKNSYTELLYSRTLDDTFANALAITSLPGCSVYLYDKYGDYAHSFDKRVSSFAAIMHVAANRQAIESRQWILFPAIRDIPNIGPARLISLVRPVYSLGGIEYGYLEVQDDYSELRKICDVGATGQVFILDGRGREVFPLETNDEHPQPRLRPGDVLHQQGTVTVSRRDLYAYAWSDYTGYTVFVKERASTVLAPLVYLRTATYAMILAVTLFALAMVYVISLVLMGPIRKLRDSVIHVNLDNMKLTVDDRSGHDEIQLLNRAFQDMLQRLGSSIERARILDREEMNARFAALQARIAPHFIHNVLYIISILAHEKRTDDVELTCKRLSDMLRYVVRSPSETVTIGDEIAYTLDYLSLQKQIYDDFLCYTVNVDPAARPIALPRLVIQPLIENSIHNGFKNKLPPWEIDVACRAADGRWSITVADNGCGIDEETTRMLLGKLASERSEIGSSHPREDPEIEGMGILNTYSRLHLLYGDRLGFTMHANELGGTTVHISGPLTRTAEFEALQDV